MTIGLGPGIGLIGTAKEEAALQALASEEVQEAEPPEGSQIARGKSKTKREAALSSAKNEDEEVNEAGEERAKDDESIEGVEEDSNDYIMVSGGRLLHVLQYYGKDWEAMIVALHSVEAMPLPPNMPTKPYDYQLKAAAQIDFLRRGPFRAALVGDPMGLGKTLQAILSMMYVKDEPGLCLVLCPAVLCKQWVQAIHGAFEEGTGLSVLHLNNPNFSAHQILAGGYDVLVCSYEFADANYRATQKYREGIETWVDAKDPLLPKPRRPTAALASGLWVMAGLPFKRGYLDEAHMINKRDGQRHRSVMKLPVKAWVVMSSTLPHTRWDDISGYLDFVKGHAYPTHNKFMAQFSVSDGRTARAPRLKLLQRFLQAITIIRPQDVLRLPPCRRMAFPVNLSDERAQVVLELTEAYKVASNTQHEKTFENLGGRTPAIGLAIRAQMHALHPFLDPKRAEEEVREECNLSNKGIVGANAAHLNDEFAEDGHTARRRGRWLAQVAELDDDTLFDSPHLRALVDLIYSMTKDAPSRKIVVVSQYLKYLDMIAEALKRKYKIDPLRFDGTVPQSTTGKLQQEFAGLEARPMLMTAGTGCLGLNLTQGKLMLQAEEWWSRSAEVHAISRLHGQGQENKVVAVKFFVHNSSIDAEISRVRNLKARINTPLFKPLIHRHDETPAVVKLLN
ncbi:P-loop containing nucleoside triphosphate hydrolase protein [Pyrenochaeta sp. MPI-SDFR-AT-0127]|nr:P-loop containing nucleoside triphosphate hydrolase protein [Pyrenochaeta sp. MPI-SDFR-AT-0127]